MDKIKISEKLKYFLALVILFAFFITLLIIIDRKFNINNQEEIKGEEIYEIIRS